jgi:hypothetical protein
MSVQVLAKAVAQGDMIEVGDQVLRVVDVHISQYSETVCIHLESHPTVVYYINEPVMVHTMAYKLA